MTATDPSEIPPTEAHGDAEDRKVLQATKPEIQFFALVAVIALIWIGATVLFGFGGLIVGALVMVFAMMALLMWISRG